ncbi:MAG: hypothetical protein RLZZ198_943 [Bacteroidota bacterium]|jgi:hypothetical protein
MKLKKISVYLFLFAVYTQFYSQMWVPATPFPGAIGFFDPNSNGKTPRVNCLDEYNGDLIVAGNFSSIGGLVAHCIAKWNGTAWSTLGPGNYLQNTYITDVCEYNNRLYVGARFNNLHVWDGNQWTIPTYFNLSTQQVENVSAINMHVFNNELYLISDFGNLLKYDGNTFLELNVPNQIGTPICIADYNNELYLGTDLGLFKFNNQNWINCTGVVTNNPTIVDLETYNGELYAIGVIFSIGGISVEKFAKYNGQTWSSIPMPNGFWPAVPSIGTNSDVSFNSLKVYDNKLFVSAGFGTYQNHDFDPTPLYIFDGTSWNLPAINFSTPYAGNTSIVYQNEIFSGGNFSTFLAGNPGNPSNITHLDLQCFAKLDPSIVSIEKNGVLKIDLSPNPTSSEITITSDKFTNEPYTLFDQMGRTVGSGKLSGTNTTISLSNLSKGIYILKVEGAYESAIVVKE